MALTPSSSRTSPPGVSSTSARENAASEGNSRSSTRQSWWIARHTCRVNLFLLGWSGETAVDVAAAEGALRRLLDRLPFFPGRPVDAWSAPSGTLAAAWVTHGPEQTGGIEYVRAEPD